MCERCNHQCEYCLCACSRGLSTKCYPCLRYSAEVLTDEEELKAHLKKRRKIAELEAKRQQPTLF